MPVSSEENFQEKLLIFNDWLKNKERYRGEDISVSPHKSSEASGFSNETFSCTVLGKNIREDIVLRIKLYSQNNIFTNVFSQNGTRKSFVRKPACLR